MKVLYISGPFSHHDLIHQVEVNILSASAVALEGWRQSDGARWEKQLAEKCGLWVIDYETAGLPEAPK